MSALTREAAALNRHSADFSFWRMFFLFLALFTACYVSVLTHDFGVSDDYPVFYFGPGVYVGKWIVEGRPLLAAITYLFGMFVKDLEDLRWVRFVSITGTALLASSMVQVLVRAGCDRYQSFSVCLIMGSTMPFQLCAAWATIASWPFAALASGLAILLSDRAFDENRPRRRWAMVAGACSCMLAALSIYQPTAMFFWVFAAVRLLAPRDGGDPAETLRRLACYCMIFAVGMLSGFAVYKLGAMLYPDGPYGSRGGLISAKDVPARFLWFAHSSVKDSLNFLILPETYRMYNGLVAVILSSFIIVGLALYFKGTLAHRLLKYGLTLGFLVLAHGIMLIVERHEGGYRTLMPLVSLVILYLYMALRGYAASSPMRRFASPFSMNSIVGVAAAACVLASSWQVRSYFVVPSVKELAFIRSELSKQDLSLYRGIHVIRPGPLDRFVPMQYAAAASRFRWTPAAMVGFVLRDLDPQRASLPVTNSPPGGPRPPIPSDTLILDMRKGIFRKG